MPASNNPAGRLADVLDALRRQPPKDATIAALKAILGSGSNAEFAAAFGQLQMLPERIERALYTYADPEHEDINFMLGWRPRVDAALATAWNLQVPLQNVTNQYTDEDVARLRFCSSVLSRAKLEARVTEEQLHQLAQQVDELHMEVVEATAVPLELRTFLLEQLDRVRIALREYRIRGAEALRDVIERVVGSCVVRADITSTDDEESASFLLKLRKIVVGVGIVAGAIGSTLALPPAFEAAIASTESVISTVGDQPAEDCTADLPKDQ
ncbi:hypothetical protein IU474_14390 [Nocardia otitidiscaviarum]|uniref:hypothetical protein n=1 Tax=Nocardia otitidiscaviarum TaxID=1823 RepID=UPI001894A45C|nr:hypothetical protein [Nocardia otitidiscaviarum]MBF6238245.1 hypothetical protein [Nocardia otitidiscaviarum]